MAAKKTEAGATNAVQRWDEEMAKYAEQFVNMENSVQGGSFFSLRSGQLTFNDLPIIGNMMGVIIVDHMMENVYYPGDFDPENIQGPECFAFAREEKALKPHEMAAKPHAPNCEGCELNQWGSADKGRGKACRNTRRVGMLMAGEMDANTGKFKPITDPEHYENAQFAYMKLPVTSVKGFAQYIRTLGVTMKKPPFAFFTRVKVVPHAKNQFMVVFEPISEIPQELFSVIVKRHEELRKTIDFPYQPFEDEKAKTAATKTVTKRGRK